MTVASVLLSLRHGLLLFPALALAFATLHFSYGIGFLAGLVKFAGDWGDRGNAPLDEPETVAKPTEELNV